MPTGDEVTALLLLILAGENDTSFHPARTTRRSGEEDELSWRGRGRLSRVDRAKDDEDEDNEAWRSCRTARLVMPGTWTRDEATADIISRVVDANFALNFVLVCGVLELAQFD